MNVQNEPEMDANDTLVKRAFERPEWYLTRTEFNIAIRVETIAEFVGRESWESILDIGCGNGSLSLHLLNADNHLTLLDRSKTMLEIASSRIPAALSSRVEKINSDFMQAQFQPHSFDLIICVGVLAYIADRREFVARLKSLLKPGGSLILECTDGSHFFSRLDRAYQALRDMLKPLRLETVIRPSAEVEAICRDTGFKLCQSYRYTMPLPVMARLMSQKASYKFVRSLFGAAARNRFPKLGNECVYHFKTPR
jgi:2-polyprenyl-3-methyl-5-hydroxy-6-metoxy-1,4-benzoquinol methylase